MYFVSFSTPVLFQLLISFSENQKIQNFRKFFKNFSKIFCYDHFWPFFFSRLVRWFVTVRSLSLDWIRKKGTKEKMTKSGARESLITLYVTNISNINSDKIVHQKSKIIHLCNSLWYFMSRSFIELYKFETVWMTRRPGAGGRNNIRGMLWKCRGEHLGKVKVHDWRRPGIKLKWNKRSLCSHFLRHGAPLQK